MNQAKPKESTGTVDEAFEALKTFDWGVEYKPLRAIDDELVATEGKADARKALETRLAAVLKTGATRAAKDFVCRKLMVIGTAESAPTLAEFLSDKDLSHMSRYALERIPSPAAGQALLGALPKLSGSLKVGVIGSLGVRRDEASVAALAALLADGDKQVAAAAAHALGLIGNAEAAQALAAVAPNTAGAVQVVAIDGLLFAAEQLLAAGKKPEAAAAYKSLLGKDLPKNVRVAVTRGMLAVAGKKKD